MSRFIRRCFKGLVIISAVCAWSSLQATMDSMDPALIRERIKPVGQVNVAPVATVVTPAQQPNPSQPGTSSVNTATVPVAASTTATPSVSSTTVPATTTTPAGSAPTAANGQVSLAIGEKIFNSKCTVCHTPGLAGAPKVGDVAAWKPRIAKGMDVLLSHVTNGFNAMPPKGTCTECSDPDLKSALEYIVSRAK